MVISRFDSEVMAINPMPLSSVPQSSGYFEVNGHKLYWERYGPEEGPIIVCMHHGLGSARSWKRQIPIFVHAGWQVLTFDRWGYGRSDPRPEFAPRFLHQDTQETIALLDAHGVDKACFLGHSDGGSIAIILAADHPHRVIKMILVAAHIYVEPKMASGLSSIEAATAIPPFSAALKHEHGNRAQDLVKAWLSCWLRHGFITLELRDELSRVRCPTLVIQGEEDEHATAQHARDIASGIKGSSLWLIPGVGHMPPHEIPGAFNQRVLAFLKNNDRSFPSVDKNLLENGDV